MRQTTVHRLGALSLLLTLLLAACGTSDDDPPAPPIFRLDGGYPTHEAGDLSVIFGTPDLAVGAHRIAFALSDAAGVVRHPAVELRAHAPDAADGAQPQLATATFAEFPLGFRGVYITQLTFDRPGEWQLEVTTPAADSAASIRFAVEIAETTSAPDIGDTAPDSVSRTLEDVESLSHLSSGADPDPALYTTSIDRALEDGRPLVVVFASPGFFTNALCGPQAEVVSDLRARYPNAATYIHVDIYENPQQLREGNIDAARRTPLLEDWGLDTDEWTFIVDSAGRITHRFESFAPFEELEPALLSVIAP